MRKSTNFDLNLVEGNDIVNPLVQDVPNYEKIDLIMKQNRDQSVSNATELKTGNVHAITREHGDSCMFRFVATSKYTSGETFTVDGMQVTALLPNGTTLPTGAYVIGANVLCCLTGTTLTIMCGVGGEYVAYDSERLGGKGANEYATQADVNNVGAVAQSAKDVADSVSVETAFSGGLAYNKYTDGRLEIFGTVLTENANDYYTVGRVNLLTKPILSKPASINVTRKTFQLSNTGVDIIPYGNFNTSENIDTYVSISVGLASERGILANLGTNNDKEVFVEIKGFWK